ncbi:methyltransferase domain-containing protein [Thiothrix sp.]|jgi:predicted SAM-dependent methyltransferase|uniref:class I SAM-dependent methyltransferase n=1 Tax=Thiothrix sp. TaxID=1032 RepID=UPI00257AD13D|nr:methyltransferase domain-containing protein [Thiothrix sp.]
MRLLIQSITSLILWIRHILGITINNDHSTQLKINLGCGLAVTQGWINIDGSFNALIAPLPLAIHKIAYKLSGSNHYYTFDEYHKLLKNNIFYQANLNNGIPTKDNSIDYIYTSHFLEHLYPEDAKKLIQDSYRTLKNGGLIRIIVPDLDYAIKLFNEDKKKQALDSYFFNGGSKFDQHKYMYDYVILHDLLKASGFSNISKLQYKTGLCPDIEILDKYQAESIFVEATK